MVNKPLPREGGMCLTPQENAVSLKWLHFYLSRPQSNPYILVHKLYVNYANCCHQRQLL
ncbi:hypothetical protein O77CONTIG1_04121 [Leptolyngbya sp. O-77]|nr:hypothetical protein O77CONTIG1_04121 [Leptolyngbya sp. O-77]